MMVGNSKTTDKPMLVPKDRRISYAHIALHVLLWGIIFGLPFFFMERGMSFNWQRFYHSVPSLLSFVAIFYINYLYLIKTYLFKGKTTEFILINLFLIIILAVLVHLWYNYQISLVQEMRPGKYMRRKAASPLLFVVRNFTSLLLVAGLSVAIKMSRRWFEMESERKELQKAKTEAELQNIKNQINPHFLLNTLNNIYALIEFDPPKARQAVMELSKLLRHLLYENNQELVPLRQEVHFIQNYIELMRIRLSDNVQLTTHFLFSEQSNILIPPLIFISLIENAFKHGIGGDKPSFIDIYLKEHADDGKVEFVCTNSFFPKSENDKSGNGIGIKLVKERLALLYGDAYVWKTTLDEKMYRVELILDTQKERK